ncbi:PhoH family protein [Nitrosomonas sp. sh817]|uniref:PhoH family protein n=1 Tax=Nitrosomonas sp. sh817 TaxID=3070658 RepID=UPI0027DC19F5|nr:PhoH family protein [Nitrosomonas sp. sh817]WMJ08226.1 PhoH family protein [Nitrosomonas sp. sh817]
MLVFYNPITQRIEQLEKQPAYRIWPKNAEQVFALHAITHLGIKLVTLQGVAGTGKTLLTLAGALEQKRHYKQILLSRPVVPLSNKDIGFLPGDIASKLAPYMEPLWDNLKFIKSQFSEKDKEYKKSRKLSRRKNSKSRRWPISGAEVSQMYFSSSTKRRT